MFLDNFSRINDRNHPRLHFIIFIFYGDRAILRMDVVSMKSGILVVNKPKDMTSREVVNCVGKIFNTKKVGHTGTLDPLAEGVLVLGINQGTKIIEPLTATEKEYIAEVVMGLESDTLDITGELVEHSINKEYQEQEIKDVLYSFLGSYEQEVPLYSAVHVGGKRLYEYARKKEDVIPPSRTVIIKEIEFLGKLSIHEERPTFRFRVVVSKGSYIRSLIRDIGERLGCFCIMKNLLRTRQGHFFIEDAISLEKIEEQSSLIKIEDALRINSEYDTVEVPEELELKIQNGAILPRIFSGTYAILLTKEHELLAIYQRDSKDDSLMRPWKVFLKENDK